jgi:hypothetical protein
MLGLCHVAHRLRGGGFELRAPGRPSIAVEHDHDGRRRQVQLLLEDLAGACRLEVVQGEAARPQRVDDAWRERHRDEQDDRPRGDDPAAPPDDEGAETLEDAQRARRCRV